MRKIIRASEIRPAGGGSVAYRVVLVDLGRESGARYVVWDQIFPGPDRRATFSTGDYFPAEDLDKAHDRFQVRRDRLGTGEDRNILVDEEVTVP